jgi:hypothetical protein
MYLPGMLAFSEFRVIAIIAAYNEGDVIYHVIRDLIENGVNVYLIDNNSTDNTYSEASRLLGSGLLGIERFPNDVAATKERNEYAWGKLLLRKEELAAELDAHWFIHADADEFRESLWPDMRLAEGIRLVDHLGYNAIQFQVLNFRPVNDNFVPGDDVRKYLTSYEVPEAYDELQIKAWKKGAYRIDLTQSGGHEVKFRGRRVYPFRFPLRHYAIRSSQLGKKKVLVDRLPRFIPEEKAIGWHVQYNDYLHGGSFLWQPQELVNYDPLQVRADIVARTHAQESAAKQPDGIPSSSQADAATKSFTVEEICRSFNETAGFLKLYNLASAMEKSGQRDGAAKIFDAICSVLSHVNPELAGKASYKLAVISEESKLKIQHLRKCLSLCPDHKAAGAMLSQLEQRMGGNGIMVQF